ncbi:cell surface adhesin with VCBS domains [Psychroflexus torquis ATCC 700755]|uniref:Cell surface adhesin with VCBS domains n=1 Tax=Psychroflexus torquis (strain ATCC 700755 / CIP 106069 / ACAM 623) TaxID=313595 RepID=K4IE51_PSYTT|nr:VCBS repeat-containing protein [Psychroflexus torquis]AFU68679.1 cell surface adhesin with VCBS domains [Psychroflexus torquis ATCC 700755]
MILNKRLQLVIFAMACICSVKAQDFSPISTSLPEIYNSITALGDVDNDGDMDLYLSGNNASGDIEGGLYIYHNDNYILQTTSNLPQVALGSARWADYNDDGYQDILIQGHDASVSGLTKLYINNTDNTFSELELGLPPMYLGEVAFSDFDNDGDVDISTTGIETNTWTFVTKLFINNGDNTVTEINNLETIPGMNYGRIKWADYNNDNYPDFLLSGFDAISGSYSVNIYTNNGDNTFSNSNIDLTQSWLGDTEWADYNNDGFIDLVVSVTGGYSGVERQTTIYKNIDGNTFTPLNINLPGVSHSILEWNDFNLDGLVDLLIVGATTTPGEGDSAHYVFVNNGDDTFTQTDSVLTASYYGDGDSGDINNDGRPDIVISGYDENNTPKTTVFLNQTITPSVFEPITSEIDDYFFSSSDWADIDNDGDKDLVISGALDTDANEFADTSKVDFYENNNGVMSLISQPNVQGLHLGAVKFLDIDYDGDMDLVVSGQNYDDITSFFLTVYENNSGVFTVKQELEGVIYSSIDFGDYDNDGDLDLLITGVGSNGRGTTIYNNTNGTFSDAIANLPGVQGGNAVFGDIDKDEDLDIIINGYDLNGDNYAQIFNNVDGIFSEGQIPFATADSWVTLGDYDNDGDLDLVFTGYDANYDYLSKIYNNDGTGMFTDSNIVLEGVGNSSGTTPLAWGDYDNDGDLDLVLSGTDNNFNDLTYLYRNDGTVFTLVEEGLINLGGSTNVTWSDYDNENDFDILVSGFFDDAAYVSQSVLHKNNIDVVNTQPNVPANLSNQINTDDSITFTWDNASDDFTPSDRANALNFH